MSLINSLRSRLINYQARRQMKKGYPEKACELYLRSLSFHDCPITRFGLALSLVALARFSDAETHLRGLLDHKRMQTHVCFTLFECLFMQRKWNDATTLMEQLHNGGFRHPRLEEIRKLLEDPVHRDRYVIGREYIGKAQAHIRTGDYEQALQGLRKAQEFDPANAHIMNKIGSLLLILGKDLEEARDWFEKAVAREPDHPGFRKNLVYIKRKLRV